MKNKLRLAVFIMVSGIFFFFLGVNLYSNLDTRIFVEFQDAEKANPSHSKANSLYKKREEHKVELLMWRIMKYSGLVILTIGMGLYETYREEEQEEWKKKIKN